MDSILLSDSEQSKVKLTFYTDSLNVLQVSLLDENVHQRYFADPQLMSLRYDEIRGISFDFKPSHQSMKLHLHKQQVQQFKMGLEDLKILQKYLRIRIPQLDFLEQYQILETIGKGSSGTVVKCRSVDNQIFAAKIMKKQEGLAKREVVICQILAENPHRNILSMKEYFTKGGEIIIIFPYLNGGTLYSYLATYTHIHLEEIRKTFRQILKGLEHIHSLGLIHRDIKMDNIMVNMDCFITFIIIDFGLSVVYNSVNLMEERCGTIGYIAPEVLNHEAYDQRCDIFSLAQVFHILVTGDPMFDRHLKQIQITQIIKQFHFEINKQKVQCPEIMDLLKKMSLVKSERYLAVQCLKHKFFYKQFISQKLACVESLKFKSPFHKGD